jgi:hypothetical protein
MAEKSHTLYTKRRFGAQLILELEKGFSIERIAQWADGIHFKHHTEIDNDLNIIIQNLGSIGLGPQFEMTEQEILDLAIKLISEKNNRE